MAERTQEQESALLDLNGLTVLLGPYPEDPFQDFDAEKQPVDMDEEPPAVGPDEWLED